MKINKKKNILKNKSGKSKKKNILGVRSMKKNIIVYACIISVLLIISSIMGNVSLTEVSKLNQTQSNIASIEKNVLKGNIIEKEYLTSKNTDKITELIGIYNDVQNMVEKDKNNQSLSDSIRKNLSSISENVKIILEKYKEIDSLNQKIGTTMDTGLYKTLKENDTELNSLVTKFDSMDKWYLVDEPWEQKKVQKGKSDNIVIDGQEYGLYKRTLDISKMPYRSLCIFRVGISGGGKNALFINKIEYVSPEDKYNYAFKEEEGKDINKIFVQKQEQTTGSYVNIQGNNMYRWDYELPNTSKMEVIQMRMLIPDNVYTDECTKLNIEFYAPVYDDIEKNKYSFHPAYNNSYYFGGTLNNIKIIQNRYNIAIHNHAINFDSNLVSVTEHYNNLMNSYDEILFFSDKIESTQEEIDEFKQLVKQKKETMTEIYETDKNITDMRVITGKAQSDIMQYGSESTKQIKENISNINKEKLLTLLIYGIICILSTAFMSIILTKIFTMNFQSFQKVLEYNSKGDLTKTANENTIKEFRQFAIHLNYFLSNLKGIIASISKVADDVTQKNAVMSTSMQELVGGNKQNMGIQQVVSSMEDMKNRSDTQQMETQEALSCLEEISSSSESILTNITHTSDLSKSSVKKTKEGYQSLEYISTETEKMVTKISESTEEVQELFIQSKKIEEILTAIKDISSQTDLLSLNANIEAARAGEAGKGFAIVAEEVRKLAEQTETEAEKIKSIVDIIGSKVQSVLSSTTEIKEEIETVDEAVDTFGEVFKEIATSVEHNNDAFSKTSDAMEEQVKAITVITDNIGQISENANGIQTLTTDTFHVMNNVITVLNNNCEELNDITDSAKQLNAEVKQFKIEKEEEV